MIPFVIFILLVIVLVFLVIDNYRVKELERDKRDIIRQARENAIIETTDVRIKPWLEKVVAPEYRPFNNLGGPPILNTNMTLPLLTSDLGNMPAVSMPSAPVLGAMPGAMFSGYKMHQ